MRENLRRLRPELWQQTNWRFPRLKIRLEGRHFDTIEVIQTESQAMLNTVTEYVFQDVFRK
jgi:hypothetical protein